jgi:thiamine transport system substrate-binding protein
MKTIRVLVVAICVAALASCTSSGSSSDTDATPKQVVLLAYDSFTPEEGIFNDFTAATGAQVKVVTSGDSGSLISKAILTAGNPEGDVLWGLDNTLLSRAQKADLLKSYEPVDFGDICVNADKKWFANKNLPLPQSFEDFAHPRYKNQLVVQDPVSSSPGLGFLLGTIAHFGESGWESYWRSLTQNGVRIVPDWTTAYTVEFSGSSGQGKYPLVVSYGSSPPAEVLYSPTPIAEPPTAVIESTCFRQTEYVGALRGTQNPLLAQKLVDYLLDVKFQESMPLTLFVFPVNKNAVLPELFTKFAVVAQSPLALDPSLIEEKRDTWIDTWRSIAL